MSKKRTIRLSSEAYTKLVEIMGAMQVKKRRKIAMHEVIEEILKAIPEDWYNEMFKFE